MAIGVSELALHRGLEVDEQGGVTTDWLVESTLLEQQKRLEAMPGDPLFTIVQSRAEGDTEEVQARNAANDSYARQLLAYGEQLGVDTNYAVFENDFAAANYIRRINRADAEHQTVTPILPLLPGQTREGSAYITEIMEPAKDPDSTVPRGGLYVPATAEAMLLTAQVMVGQRLEDWQANDITVGYVGYGGRTIQPLDQKLIRDKAEIGVTLASKTDIERIDDYTDTLRACDIIFTGIPRACVLRDTHVSEGTAIVDVGQGPHPETGEAAGNLDESVFAVSGIRATRLRHGVGPVTTAVIYDRVLSIHERAYRDPSPSTPVAAVAQSLSLLAA